MTCAHESQYPKQVPSGGLFWWCDACGAFAGGELTRTGPAIWRRDGWHGVDRIPVLFLGALPGGRATVLAVRVRGATREARKVRVDLASLRPQTRADRSPPELDAYLTAHGCAP